MMQYCSVSLLCAVLPGNRFANGILFGIAESIAQFYSSFLMNNMLDINAFYLNYAIGLFSYLIFVAFPTAGFHTYMANVLSLLSVGGWFNLQLLILELRVPPQNVGSVSLLTRTLAVGMGVFAPTISVLEPPIPHIVLICIATTGFIASLFLPDPGHHLQQTKQTGENSVLVIDKLTE
jgi:hypothetical protein